MWFVFAVSCLLFVLIIVRCSLLVVRRLLCAVFGFVVFVALVVFVVSVFVVVAVWVVCVAFVVCAVLAVALAIVLFGVFVA